MKGIWARLGIAAWAAACLTALAGSGAAASLDVIKARGELAVGVKADAPPFGYRDASGELTGLEVDLARDLAARLGVRLKLFPVAASSRLQFLGLGSIDVVIATIAVTEKRESRAGLIVPPYYQTEIAALTGRKTGIAAAAGLGGRTVCAVANAHYAEALAAAAPGLKPVAVRDLDEGADALRRGRCVALAGENVKLINLTRRDPAAWVDYAAVPLGVMPLPWAIAVQPHEKDAPLGQFIAAAVADWHKSGKLMALERQWLGETTGWTAAMHAKMR
jgi:polar amino acid transport system substrate-binding protein